MQINTCARVRARIMKAHACARCMRAFIKYVRELGNKTKSSQKQKKNIPHWIIYWLAILLFARVGICHGRGSTAHVIWPNPNQKRRATPPYRYEQ